MAIVKKTLKMLLTKVLRSTPRRTYKDLDYARHMPKAYVDRLKRTIPRKVYANRFGAPDVNRYYVHPDDYVPDETSRPWEQKVVHATIERQNMYHNNLLHNKYHKFRISKMQKIPDEKWTIFPGDTVQVMVGKDKMKQGVVGKVLRETNGVFVDGLHRKLEKEMVDMKAYDLPVSFKWIEQRLDVSKDEVMLVDPHDKEPCTASWVLNEAKTEWIRVSDRTGYEIPLPSSAKITYEYISPADYIEVEGKDTTTAQALRRTYVPKLCLVEQELMDELGIKEDRKHGPTYWY